jgi:hypothetical protein
MCSGPFTGSSPHAAARPAASVSASTVARSVVRGHGGDITLANRAEGGLIQTIVLPRSEGSNQVVYSDNTRSAEGNLPQSRLG